MKKPHKSNTDVSAYSLTSTVEQLQNAQNLKEANENLMRGLASSRVEKLTEAIFNTASSLPYSGTSATSDYVPKMPGLATGDSIQPCQYYPRIIVDGVDVVKLLTNIAVVTGALRDDTSKFNLDVVQHFSAERLAFFIVNESKKIISGSGDAVAELTEWLKSKAE